MVKAGLDVAQIWLDGDETLVNTIDREGNVLPINMIQGHSLTHDPLVVLVSFPFSAPWTLLLFCPTWVLIFPTITTTLLILTMD